jgi:hypothetical protein
MIPYLLRPAGRGERAFGWSAVAIIVLSSSYMFLGQTWDAGVFINIAAKYLLYCILVFSVTRIAAQALRLSRTGAHT